MKVIDIKKVNDHGSCQRCFQNLNINVPANHIVTYQNFGKIDVCEMHANRINIWKKACEKLRKN